MSESRFGRLGHRIEGVVKAISTFLGVVAGLCLVTLLVYVSANVVFRRLEGSDLPGVVDAGQVILVGLAFLSLAYAFRHDAHITISSVVDKLPPRVSAAVQAVGLAVVLGLFVWFTFETAIEAVYSFDTGETTFGLARVPVWPARASIAIGGAALVLEIASALVRRLCVAMRGDISADAPARRETPTDDAPHAA